MVNLNFCFTQNLIFMPLNKDFCGFFLINYLMKLIELFRRVRWTNGLKMVKGNRPYKHGLEHYKCYKCKAWKRTLNDKTIIFHSIGEYAKGDCHVNNCENILCLSP
jgi:hypothetical protein